MTTTERGGLQRTVGAALFLSVLAAAGAAPTTTPISYAPHGDGQRRSAGAPVALSSHAFIVPVEGADGTMSTADDATLLIQDMDGITVTALHTAHLRDGGGRKCRLSATSCLIPSTGPDGFWKTADDRLHVLTELGSGNVVTPLVVDFMSRRGTGAPVRLSESSAVLISVGPDGSEESADDEVVILTDVGGANTVTRITVPYLDHEQASRPVALSPTSFLVSSFGPDGEIRTPDDIVNLFTDVGGANTRTAIPTPRLSGSTPGRATRITATRATVTSVGPDGNHVTADDVLYLLDDLGVANTVTPISFGPIDSYTAGMSVAMTDDMLVIPSPGPDFADETADDELVVISGLGTSNTAQHITIGGIDEDRQSRPLRLAADACAIVTIGADLTSESDDDQVAIVTDVGGSNTVMYLAVPGIAGAGLSTPTALSSNAFMLRTGGPDGIVGAGGDDCVTLIEDALTAPQIVTIPTVPDGSSYTDSGLVPVNLSHGRAVFQIGGGDGVVGTGDDDGALLVDGLPRDRDFTLSKLWIKFKPAKPQKGEKFLVKGLIALDTPELFASNDVTVSIGNGAQTIPAAAFTQNKKGDWKYKDRKRENGFIKSFVYKPRNGKVTIVGKGLGTGAETTDATYVPVVIECAELFLGDAVEAEQKSKGIKYKAPK